MTMASTLEWRTENLDDGAAALIGRPTSGRHYLDGQPVHCGDLLELRLDDGSWATGRYEWSGGDTALLLFEDGIGRNLSETDVCRWPGEQHL